MNDDATSEQPKTQITDANVNKVGIFGLLRSTIKSATDNRIKYESMKTVQQIGGFEKSDVLRIREFLSINKFITRMDHSSYSSEFSSMRLFG